MLAGFKDFVIFRSHFRQYCSLSVPSLLAPSSTPGIRQESEASFRQARKEYRVTMVVRDHVLLASFLKFHKGVGKRPRERDNSAFRGHL